MAKTALNINKAFTFVFEDPKWVRKIGIAGFLTLTLIGAIPVAGWALEIQRRLIRTGKSSLPEWDAMGQYAINGLKFMLLWVITLIPFYLLAFAAISFAGRDRESFYLVTLLLQVFSFFFSMAMLLWMAVLSGRFAETYSFTQSLDLPLLFALFRANWKQFVGAAFLGYIASYGAVMIGYMLLCVGVLFTSAIGSAIMNHFYGQAYRNARRLI